MSATCLVPECLTERHKKARGWCRAHYQRWLRHGDPRGGRGFAPGVPLAHRVLVLTDRSGGPDACWPWLGARDTDGYGMLKLRYQRYRVPRLVFEFDRGHPPSPEKPCICHTCDNPDCCNPKHLWAGTPGDNNRDREEKGRSVRLVGEDHPNAKLTANQVQAARAQYQAGSISQAKLARRLGISRTTLHPILQRTAWRHVA